ncbi:MAG: sulfite exporter TauE/SafE family protein [Chloroflexota bacterium]
MLPLLLGSIAGLALGLVGGGGSILTVPLLVGVLGMPPREATTMSLVVVGMAALWGTIPHARRGNVLWSRALLFGAVGMVGALAGGAVNATVAPRTLLGGFVIVMVVAAVAMLRRAGALSLTATMPSLVYVAGGSATPAGAGSRLADRIRARAGGSCPLIDHGPFVATALGVGFMTGFFGVGGGFLIVPALVLVLRLPMPLAVGTSLPIIALNSATGFLSHLGNGATLDLPLTALFTAGAIVAALVGGAVSTRLPAAALARAFALVVLALAAFLAIQVIHTP